MVIFGRYIINSEYRIAYSEYHIRYTVYFYVNAALGERQLSRVMGNQIFAYEKNKGADQLCSNCTAVQRHYLRYLDYSTIPLHLKSETSRF